MRNGKQSSDKLRSHKRLLYDKRPIEKATEFETSCANQMSFFFDFTFDQPTNWKWHFDLCITASFRTRSIHDVTVL